MDDTNSLQQQLFRPASATMSVERKSRSKQATVEVTRVCIGGGSIADQNGMMMMRWSWKLSGGAQ